MEGIFINYEVLLDEASKSNIKVCEKINFESNSKGLIKGKKIGLSNRLVTNSEKSCVLSEELGHFYTSTGNIVDLRDIKCRKQENKARQWAFNKQVGLVGIINAFNNNCTTLYEMAEYLEVTELFLNDAIECYRQKYGIYAKLDNYTIFFEPNLRVMKMF